MLLLEELKYRIVGKVLRDVDYHKADSKSHLLKDAYVFSRPGGEFNCCGKRLAADELQKLIEENNIADFRNIEPEYTSLGIFRGYAILQLFGTCVEYWEERGLSERYIEHAIKYLTITLNYTTGSFEMSVRDFNFFVFGLLLAKSPNVFDGPKSRLELNRIFKTLLDEEERIEKERSQMREEVMQKQATTPNSNF